MVSRYQLPKFQKFPIRSAQRRNKYPLTRIRVTFFRASTYGLIPWSGKARKKTSDRPNENRLQIARGIRAERNGDSSGTPRCIFRFTSKGSSDSLAHLAKRMRHEFPALAQIASHDVLPIPLSPPSLHRHSPRRPLTPWEDICQWSRAMAARFEWRCIRRAWIHDDVARI